MQITFAKQPSAGTGAFAVGMTEDGGLLPAAEKADRMTEGALTRARKVAGFTGKAGEILEIFAPTGTKRSRLLIVGLGKTADFGSPQSERIAAAVLGRFKGGADRELTFAVDRPRGARLNEAELAAHLALGALLKSYTFDKYRTRKDGEKPIALNKVTLTTSDPSAAKAAWAPLEAEAKGVFLARDLVNEPANVLGPDEFVSRIKALSKHGVKIEVLGEKEMKRLGMGALLGVGQGSKRESKLLVLRWNGAKKHKEAPLAFVGKGLCFDSGGLSLKSGAGMMDMKGDMAGAAAVTGAILALALRKAPIDAVAVAGLTENMPGGGAQRPDDVVKTMSGQTVEVLNTDAEGRLVLADALWYAQDRFKPRFMVDLATLTGAIVVALGTEHAGLFANDDTLADRLIAAGKATGETMWRMPLSPAYDKLLKSKIADMKNVAGRGAGSITAAQFLQRFAGKTPWAHIDIAGVAYPEGGEANPLAPDWATGWGVRLLDRLAADVEG